MKSSVWMGGAVHFPEWQGERVYMVPFKQSKGLPVTLSRWQDTVDEMLDGIKTDKDIYLMIDQGIVKAGQTHRRPGPHIDGYWMPGVGHGHINPKFAGHDNPYRGHGIPKEGPGRHGAPSHFHDKGRNELILLASNITGAKAYLGDYDGEFGSGGECNFDLGGMRTINMLGGVSWIGDIYTIHESLPHEEDGLRTLVRLNVPLQ